MQSFRFAILVSTGLMLAGPALATPSSSRVFDSDSRDRLTVEFLDVSDSTWYQLWVNSGSRKLHVKWYTRSEARCDGSRCRIEPDLNLQPGLYRTWVQTWNSRGAGPWSAAMDLELRPKGSSGPVTWLDPLAFRGESGVQLNLGSLGGEPGALIARGASGEIAQSFALDGDEVLGGVRICYEAETASGFIDEVRVERLEGLGATSTTLLRDGTNRRATQPTCFDVASNPSAGPSSGLLRLYVRLALGSEVAVRAAGILVGDDPSNGGGGQNGGGNGSGGGGGGAGNGGGDDRLRCGAEGASDISMDARFEDRGSREKFDASFEAAPGLGFRSGDVLDVRVSGTRVGTMTLLVGVGGDIEGDLEFDTQIEAGDDSVPFPSNFPTVSVGTRVDVGPLGCSLAVD